MAIWLIAAAVMTAAIPAAADQGSRVVPRENVNLNDVNFSGQATSGSGFLVNMQVSCFGVNLRHGTFPLSRNADVITSLRLKRYDGVEGTVVFTVPAEAFLKDSNAAEAPLTPISQDPVDFAPRIEGRVRGGTVLVDFKVRANDGKRLYQFLNIEFEQRLRGPDPLYAATDGAVSRSLNYTYSADNSVLYIEASFPGAAGFCGSYYSPLMVFFSKKRPKFRKTAAFRLRPEGDRFHWPEGSPDWAFLALDRNENGSIDNGSELFGADGTSANGFEVLRKLDSDGDAKVTPADREFARLRLWFDRNADGRTGPGELIPLAERGLNEVSLDYEKSIVQPLGKFAELRERSSAVAKGKKIEIVDVWLGLSTPSGGSDARPQQKKSEKPADQPGKPD